MPGSVDKLELIELCFKLFGSKYSRRNAHIGHTHSRNSVVKETVLKTGKEISIIIMKKIVQRTMKSWN